MHSGNEPQLHANYLVTTCRLTLAFLRNDTYYLPNVIFVLAVSPFAARLESDDLSLDTVLPCQTLRAPSLI